MPITKVFHGTIIHCLGVDEASFQVFHQGILGVDEHGKIAFLEDANKLPEIQEKYKFGDDKIENLGKRFIIPGLIDTHIHAPQYPNAGTGTDVPLLDWLNKYTFPLEQKYCDSKFAKDVFTKAVKRSLSYGTTTACYFSSIHLEATKVLAEVTHTLGQRALIGKVCMDRNSPDFYKEDTKKSIEETEQFILFCKDQLKSPLVTPVITPRFVPTCSSELMNGLGELSKKYNVPIQSHISENKDEVNWVSHLHPDCTSYSNVYDKHNLLNDKTIMAHGIYLSDEELILFKERNAGLSHCPVSNYLIHSGILDVRRVLRHGIKLGLGTDVSGGCSSSLLEVIRMAVAATNTYGMQDKNYKPLSYKELFALATIGGAQVLALDEHIGNFKVGKYFDALIVNPESEKNTFEIYEHDKTEDIFQKFIFLGDDRSIEKIFVHGVVVKQ